jgi:aspartate dehydrogenase
MMRVGLVGCGTIGTQLALALQRDYASRARVVALHDEALAHARALAARLRPAPVLCSLPELIRRSDLVLEAASASIAAEVAVRALRAHRNVFIMSIGGLLRNREWQRVAARSRAAVYMPSGALAGLDGVKALAMGRIRRVQLTTFKPPRALASAPYVQRKRLNLTRLTRPRLLYEGSPQAAVQGCPQNTNVAAAVTLASGVSSSRIRIRVVADPALRRNRHELEVDGDCGRIHCTIESEPSANPKTSELAIRSALATLQQLFSPIRIGT